MNNSILNQLLSPADRLRLVQARSYLLLKHSHQLDHATQAQTESYQWFLTQLNDPQVQAALTRLKIWPQVKSPQGSDAEHDPE